MYVMPPMATADPVRFHESNLWSTPIRDLDLTITGTRLEPILNEFRGELEAVGLTRVRPRFYLSTEWGVPFETVAIAIPFYLARPDLTALHAERVGHVEGFDRSDILRYLRHEMGHVANYAYRLYDEEEWVKQFGSITQPYGEDYRPEPFSRRYVRHLPGWYAQKHPDEDFAETFAVWLAPRSNWRRRYRGWPAMRKLGYVERTMRRIGGQEPVVHKGDFDVTVDDLHLTVEEFYARNFEETRAAESVAIDADLEQIFFRKGHRRAALVPAADVIERHRLTLTNTLTHWTGVHRPIVRRLVQRMARRARELDLYGTTRAEPDYLVQLTAFGTTLAMHYVSHGDFTRAAR